MRVLVVDDNAVNRELASSLLEWWGIEAVLAADGAEAVQLVVGGGVFDLVLMDIQMPVMDGLAASRFIREFELEPTRPHHRVPIVAWTAATILDGVADLQQFGLDELLAKPVSSDAMSACLGRWCPGKFQLS
jgi:CheY-like chemotaxis protein